MYVCLCSGCLQNRTHCFLKMELGPCLFCAQLHVRFGSGYGEDVLILDQITRLTQLAMCAVGCHWH